MIAHTMDNMNSNTTKNSTTKQKKKTKTIQYQEDHKMMHASQQHRIITGDAVEIYFSVEL